MGKDPAFLFYHHDFLVGTAFMSMRDKGAYITLLCYMAAMGPLSLKQMEQMVGKLSANLRNKFKIDERGMYYNERLLQEVQKRADWCKSRNNNKMGINQYTKSGSCDQKQEAQQPNEKRSYGGHMVNENENTNTNTLKTLKAVYSEAFNKIWQAYPSPVGKKEAYKHYSKSVITDQDNLDIWTALGNYKSSRRVVEGFIQDGKTWFNNWKDWVEIKQEDGSEWKTKSLIRR